MPTIECVTCENGEIAFCAPGDCAPVNWCSPDDFD